MSRIGKQPIIIPEGTEVTVSGNILTVKGKAGELSKKVHEAVSIEVKDNQAVVTPNNETRLSQALWGTFASHVSNMVAGVNEPFEKKLSVEGIGYKVALEGSTLKLQVGFSHPVELTVPEDITVEVEKNQISVKGVSKENVGQFAAEVRAVKKPEPYKGKGIRYVGEIVRRKEGKKAAA
ncbi:50S ribosomal protein L6 [Candidatus Kaiserbacteria bacterium]|nr:MAG: 50S ribosomal protein L6 [Candidatus Kaiserbacteria bacterium]